MSKISEYAKVQTEYNTRLDAAIEGIRGDIESLNKTITDIQTSVGVISAEDQASLDALQVRGEAMATKLEAIDALTETAPTPPPS